MIITDDKLINCIDLAFYYCLVSYYTNCVQHSSDKIAKWTTKIRGTLPITTSTNDNIPFRNLIPWVKMII